MWSSSLRICAFTADAFLSASSLASWALWALLFRSAAPSSAAPVSVLVVLPVRVLVSLFVWALGISVCVSASFLDRCIPVPALASSAEVLVSLSLWALGISVLVSASFLDRCLSVPALAFLAVVLERLLWSLARLLAWPLAVFPVGFLVSMSLWALGFSV